MIPQMKTLLRIKNLKEREALRGLQAVKRQLETAQAAKRKAERDVEESERTYATREDAIYVPIVGQVVQQNDMDGARGRVVKLESDHNALKDALERARHIEHRLDLELEKSTLHYRQAVKNRDKFQLITDDLVAVAVAEGEHREEMEAEELSARPKARIA